MLVRRVGGGAQDCRSNDDGERGGKKHVGGARRFEPGTSVEFPSVFLVTIQNRIFSLLDLLHNCISQCFV